MLAANVDELSLLFGECSPIHWLNGFCLWQRHKNPAHLKEERGSADYRVPRVFMETGGFWRLTILNWQSLSDTIQMHKKGAFEMNKKVFLGGTCNGSRWREEIKPLLKIDYFDPVVSGEWTEEAYQRELRERTTSDFVTYVITPKMAGFYSIAEVADDSNKRPEKTLFCYIMRDEDQTFNSVQLKSLKATARMVKNNGGKVFETIADMAAYLNAGA